MRTLITGGAGFIGSHLCERFLAEGHEVICLDNFITGNPANILHLQSNPKFMLLRHNISNHIEIDGPIDNILHFASPASPVDYLRHPIPTLKVGSLGTHNSLGLAKAKNARFLLASTSEVYGDPERHPQREDYWGNVNPIGVRGVYDEAKRFAEAMTMAYHRYHDIRTNIIRIFNSVLADQFTIAFDEDGLFLGPIGELADRVRSNHEQRRVFVPVFNPATLCMEVRPALALTEHQPRNDAFELRLAYGRNLKVTGDHSVFVRALDGTPVAKPARQIRKGEEVAIPARLPIIERDRTDLHLSDELFRLADQQKEELWEWTVCHPDFARVVQERRGEIHHFLEQSGRFSQGQNFHNTIVCTSRKWIRRGMLPLPLLHRLEMIPPPDAWIVPYQSSNRKLPNFVPITEDLLWLLGFYLAEGAEHAGDGTYFISFASDEHYLRRAKTILETTFKVHVGYSAHTPGRAPSIYVHSKLLHRVFRDILRLRDRRIPAWVMQLPLHRVKHFLEGFRCGDGTHSGKKLGHELCFDTTSEGLAIDLNYLLLRFGIVASFGRYETTFRQRYGERRFPFYRLTICSLDNFDILSWDRGVHQNLMARRHGDLVWARVREIRPCVLTHRVYDFSVPECENFVAGSGVFAHNTYGERMRLDDGRVVPNLMGQALRGEPLTVYGDGSQTRSFCYVSDLVEGIFRLLRTDFHEPVNLGNPNEVSILDFAKEILALSGGKSELLFKPLPQDDPKVRRPDITRARTLLGWEPKVDRHEGMRRTMEFFSNTLRS